MKQALTYLLLLCVLGATAQAQPAGRARKKADKLFSRLAYAQAIPWYEKALKKKEDADGVYQLAECYRLSLNPEKAAQWYAKLKQMNEIPADAWFWIGHYELQRQEFRSADTSFRTYADLRPGDDRGPRFANEIRNLELLSHDSSEVSVDPLNINSPQSDFGAMPWNGGIVFASSREQGGMVNREFEWLGEPFLDLWFALPAKDSSGHKWKKPELLKGDVNSQWHECNFSSADSGRTAYFSRNQAPSGKTGPNMLLRICSATWDGKAWKDVKEFPHNQADFSLTHPFVTPDGKRLWFVSDMPGGAGGKDIWFCEQRNGEWSQPQNIGSPVNTEGDEMFPYEHPDGTLYFASNSHPGFGNLDVFSWKRGGAVKNAGLPVNSSYDDFAYWLDKGKQFGFLSSNRPGGKGKDDIWAFLVRKPDLRIRVMDKVAQLPVEQAHVYVDDSTGVNLWYGETDSTGVVSFKVDQDSRYQVRIETPDFDVYRFPVFADPEAGEDALRFLIELYNPPPAITAIVVDDATRERLAGARVEIVPVSPAGETMSRFTDRNGRFSVKFGANSQYSMTVRQPGYLTWTGDIHTGKKGYDGDTIIPMKLEKIPFEKVFRLEHIHYEFDKADIRTADTASLSELAKLLRDNPGLTIELSSHTDCRGTSTYNQSLSQRRAESARSWLVKRGISANRIQAVGYGESRPVNACTDGTECSEAQHFENRRTEFRITGTIDGKQQNIQSQNRR